MSTKPSDWPIYEPSFPTDEEAIPAPNSFHSELARAFGVSPLADQSERPPLPEYLDEPLPALDGPIPYRLAAPPTGFQKDDSLKIPLDMLPFDALSIVAKVMQFGAYQAPRPDGSRGYGRDNWKACEDVARYDAAMLRHYAAIQGGETNDPASGLPHAAHLACCALFSLWMRHCK